ncbi:MAG: formyltransferase family protein [Bacteroidota bacterium]
MDKRVVLLTRGELRHEFFRKYLASRSGIEVQATFCESNKGNIDEVVKKDLQENNLRTLHLSARAATEEDFFKLFNDHQEDFSNPIFIEKGEINDAHHVQSIIQMNPDLIISYGCSIIKSRLLSVFRGRFINIHLGLSPYYRGSGTNFWPFVNDELQFVGTTFMYIDEGIDTGEIIHQIRAKILYKDNIHQIGNRLIRDSFFECVKLIRVFGQLEHINPPTMDSKDVRYYRKKDFTEGALIKAYKNVAEGIVEKYLENKLRVDKNFPIIKNPII